MVYAEGDRVVTVRWVKQPYRSLGIRTPAIYRAAVVDGELVWVVHDDTPLGLWDFDGAMIPVAFRTDAAAVRQAHKLAKKRKLPVVQEIRPGKPCNPKPKKRR